MHQFRLGDIFLFQHPEASRSIQKSNLGLVYDNPNDTEFQILHLISGENPDQLHSIKIGNKDLIEGKISQDYVVVTNRMELIEKESIAQKVGRINVYKIDEILRQMAHNITAKHYDSVHKKDEDFIPGETSIHYAGRVYNAEEMNMLVDSALDFWLTAGRFADRFEKELASFLSMKHCILTNSGSSANLLAISALTSPKLEERRLKPGDEIITTAAGFPTTISPIVQNKLIPVFVDIEFGTYNVNVSQLEKAISEKTKAMILAHTLGNPFDLDKVMEIVNKYDLWLIEDNCDALGSQFKKKYTGTFGHITTQSFYPAHHITMGEGGALLTNDSLLKKLIISFRDWGRDCWCLPGQDNTCGKRFKWQLGDLPIGYDHKYTYSHMGYNLKITDMQAAVGVAQFNKIPDFIDARKKNWKILYEGLKEYEKDFILPRAMDHSDPNWFGFLLTVKEEASFSKNEIVKCLEDNKIATRTLFAGNIIRQPCCNNLKYRIIGDLKNTDFIMNNAFWIGVYPGMTNAMLEYIISKIQEFVDKK